MTRLVPAVSMAIVLGMAFPAPAHFGIAYRSRATTAYYFAVPAAVVVFPAPAVCMPLPYANPPRLLAQPRPAPASSGAEPPLLDSSKEGPSGKPPVPPESGKGEVRSARYYDSYAVAPGAVTRPGSGLCSVNFWNLAAQDLTLQVGERRVTLGSGRSLTLDLDRQFTWQIEGRDAQTARVDPKDSGLEIVIRR